MDKHSISNDDFYQLSRIAIGKGNSSVRLYLAKLIRRLRKTDPDLASKIEDLLKTKASRSSGVLRDSSRELEKNELLSPTIEDSGEKVELLKHGEDDECFEQPLWEGEVEHKIQQLVSEHKSIKLLSKKQLLPTSSVIFDGPPGVGKTLTAKWLAFKLGLPFYTLDLTTVMSSYLGQTGSNLRKAIDYAKTHPCLLLLDEIDGIAKKRSDDSDVGELKRLVTVMLQELENWSSEGILVAATNHAELVDPALWRRFDMIIKFPNPSSKRVHDAINRFMGEDLENLKEWITVLEVLLEGSSYSDIERTVLQLRRLFTIAPESFPDSAINLLFVDSTDVSRSKKIEIATGLVSKQGFSQHKASKITGVARGTIRKNL